MSALDHASLVLVAALMAVILAGIWRNRLGRLCRTFVAYVIAVGGGAVLIAAWPGTFYNWSFWQAKELTYSALSFLVALEVASLSFQAFPGARTRARQLAVVVAVATLSAIGLIPAGADDASGSVSTGAALYVELQPRIAHGTVMLLAGVWGLILWYVVPLHRWHRAVLRGLLPYMLLFTVAVRLLVSWGWHASEWIGYADSVVYLIVLCYWSWEAWRREPEEPAPEILRRLQPWLDKR